MFQTTNQDHFFMDSAVSCFKECGEVNRSTHRLIDSLEIRQMWRSHTLCSGSILSVTSRKLTDRTMEHHHLQWENHEWVIFNNKLWNYQRGYNIILDIGSSSLGYWMLKKNNIHWYPVNWTHVARTSSSSFNPWPPRLSNDLQPMQQKKDVNKYSMCNNSG